MNPSSAHQTPDDMEFSGGELPKANDLTATRKRTIDVIGEAGEKSPVEKLNALLSEVTAIEDKTLSSKDVKRLRTRATDILKEAEASGIINVDSKRTEDFIITVHGHQADADEIRQIFSTIMKIIKSKKAEVRQELAPDELPSPKKFLEQTEVSAGKPKDPEAVEGLRRLIESGIERIKKADRIATSGRNIGVVEIMKSFVEMRIVKTNGASYSPNPEIEMAKVLAKAANAKIYEINERLKQKRASYEAVLHARNGFERVSMADDGKSELTRYAYQIHLEEKAGQEIIVIDKVEVKFTGGGVRILRVGERFEADHSDTPDFLKQAARTLKFVRPKD